MNVKIAAGPKALDVLGALEPGEVVIYHIGDLASDLDEPLYKHLRLVVEKVNRMSSQKLVKLEEVMMPKGIIQGKLPKIYRAISRHRPQRTYKK